MPKPATGSTFLSRGAWYARVTLNDGKRKAFRLTDASEAAANARRAVLADIAAKLRRAGHGERAEAFCAEAATASPEDLAAVVQLADALCRGEVKPIAPKPTPLPAGTETVASLARRWTSGELARLYPDHLTPLKRAALVQCLIDKHITPAIGDVTIPDVALEHVENVMRAYRGEASSRRTVGALVSRLLSLAVYPLKIIKASPIPKGFFKTPKGDKAKGYLYPDEDRKLLACHKVPLRLRMLYGFLAREGMRASEAESLTLGNIDLKRGAVTLDENKTDDPRAWALSAGVVRAMRVWKTLRERDGAGPEDRIFVVDDGEISHRAETFRAHLRAAGIDRAALFERSASRRPIRAHDLRATFVTISLANGRTEAWIADRTGHRSSEMINRYRRAARTVAELELGDLTPLDEAIPELAFALNGSGNGYATQKPAASPHTIIDSVNMEQHQRGLIARLDEAKCADAGDGRARFDGCAGVSRTAAANVLVPPEPPLNDPSWLAWAAWSMLAFAATERAAAA